MVSENTCFLYFKLFARGGGGGPGARFQDFREKKKTIFFDFFAGLYYRLAGLYYMLAGLYYMSAGLYYVFAGLYYTFAGLYYRNAGLLHE